jgi:hypothetical protein
VQRNYRQKLASSATLSNPRLDLGTQYIAIGPGEKKILKFVPERGIAKVVKMYNGEPTEKCRFFVIDSNSGSDAGVQCKAMYPSYYYNFYMN